jgi:ATP-dependent DNA helicase RecQ
VKRPAATVAIADLSDGQKALEERLKQWRRDEAKQVGLPSFFIFSDTVLRNIALAGPVSIGALRDVRGVSPEKLDRFGAAVVEIVRG